MFVRLKRRYITYFCILLLIFVFLSISVYKLTVNGRSVYASSVASGSSVSVAVSGARGSIYDANGVLLAYDTVSHNVQFYKDPAKNASSDRANYTRILMDAISIIEKNGDSMIDTFMIKKNDSGEFVYDLSSGLDEETRTKRIDSWCSNMLIADPSMSPENIYYELRSRYRIPETADYEEARKLLSIWQEVQLNSYQSYIPITIATNVNFTTISTLETHANELTGISVVSSYIRVYPKSETAAHVIGYLGKMVDEQEIADKKAQGYSVDDLVGKVGVEATMERYLSGSVLDKQGKKTVQLDKNGSIVSEELNTEAKQGDSVVLTLDIGLQEAAEEALAQNIAQDYQEQQQMYVAKKNEYDELLDARNKKEIDFIKSGAAIVMEVKTGRILALASYPSFDLNLFTGGISDEEYQKLLDTPGAPLFDNAISSTSTPGSIFKMATAVAGLMENKITVNTLITDKGPYDKYITGDSKAPECWIRPNFSRHGTQNVSTALKNSCNYFFFEVADRLGIDKLTEWAGNLGLTSKTNIELTGESIGFIGGQQVLYDSTKSIENQKSSKPLLIYNKLLTQLKEFGTERGVEYTEEQLSEAALGLMKLVELSSFSIGPDIRGVLSQQLDIPENVSLNRGWSSQIMDTIRELIWTATDTVTMGIGATPTQLTPIAVARYMCAIANGGKVYDAHIVDKIIDSQGDVIQDIEPTLVRDLQIPESFRKTIMEGMEQVVSLEDGGTAGTAFKDFEYQDIIAGKTGTAPISNIELEDNVWLCLVAPKDDPEIAVVLFLPNGYSDSKAYPTAKAIISYYFHSQEANSRQNPEEGSLIN